MSRRKILVADLLCGAGGSSTGCERALQIAWAAGIIEGEGSIQAAVRKRRGADGGALVQVVVRVVMSDEDVVTRLRDVFGVGRVNPYRNTQGLGSKPLFRWDISRRAQASAVCDAIYPWMGERRRGQIDHLRRLLAEHPPIDTAERIRRTWAARRANVGAA